MAGLKSMQSQFPTINPSKATNFEALQAEKDFVYSSNPLQANVEHRVTKIFDVFDTQHVKIVDVGQVSTIVRALDLCPTEANLQEIISAVEEPSTKGSVRFGAFVKYITNIILGGEKFQQHGKEEMMRFFHKLDRKRRGTIDPQKLKDVICREGEPFTLEEAEEMLQFALNKDDGLIYYEDYVDKTLGALTSKNF